MTKLKNKKVEGAIGIPDEITAMFLVPNYEEFEKVRNTLKYRKPEDEFLITSCVKVLYRKDVWEIAE